MSQEYSLQPQVYVTRELKENLETFPIFTFLTRLHQMNE